MSRGLFLSLTFALIGFAAQHAAAQPVNDNFGGAIPLQGPNGVMPGNNDGGTLEVGEPSIAGAPGGASIWYVWTAPANGAYTFSTAGSVVQDTVLGVFTGNSVDNLTIVAENDDADTINNILTSRLTFIASAGTTYYIKIDSYDSTVETGDLTLNWGPNSIFAGDFSFTSQLYLYGDREVLPRLDGRMADANPTSTRAKVTLTRRLGYSGRVLVDYTITNTFYTNYYITNFYGTNIYNTNIGVTLTYSNILLTNIVWSNLVQNCEYGQFGYSIHPGAVQRLCTESGGTGPDRRSCTNSPITPVPTNILCDNFVTVTNSGGTNFTRTQVFCVSNIVQLVVPTAYPVDENGRGDYVPISATATNDDFQTSVDVGLTYSPTSFSNSPPVNRVLVVTIDNVYLDPLETQDIPAPIADPNIGPIETLVNILNMNAQGGTNDVNGTGRVQGPRILFQLADDTGSPFNDTNGVPVADENGNPPTIEVAPGAGIVGTNTFNFERAVNRCDETVNNTRVARIWVLRSGNNIATTTASVNYRIDYDPDNGVSANDTFRNTAKRNFAGGVFDWSNPEIPLQPGSDYATPSDCAYPSPSPTDYTNVTGTLTFGPGVTRMPIDIGISNDNVVEFNEDLLLQLYTPANDLNAYSLGYLRDSILTILFDSSEQPAGACDVTHNPDNNSGTVPPYNQLPGANSTVYAIGVQADGKAIIGGDFQAYNTVPRYRIARVNIDGSIDTSFNAGAGADQFVSCLFIDGSGKIVLGGGFNSMGGVSRRGLARLNGDGTLDNTFNPGLGANATVWAIASHTNGSILVAGQFTTFSGTNRAHIARVSAAGILDPTFDPGAGPNDQVLSMAVQSDGKIVIGGSFTNVAGYPRFHIARLNLDGTVDTSFDPGSGADGNVYAVAVQNDGGILLGGDFGSVRTLNRNGIARLNADGSLDTTFDPASGADDTVYSITLQSDGKPIIGGLFRNYNQTRRLAVARLYTDGTLDTTFMDCAFNQFAGLPNHYYDPGVEAPNFVLATALQADGNVLIGGLFENVGGGGTRTRISPRNCFARLIGGATAGPGNIELTRDTYTADENGGRYFVTMRRNNGYLGEAAVTIAPQILPPAPGNAVEGTNGDFTFNGANYANPTWVSTYPPPPWTWQIQDGTWGQNQGFSDTSFPNPFDPTNTFLFQYGDNDVYIDINDNTVVDGNRSFNLQLSVPRGAIKSSFYPFYFPGQFDPTIGFPDGLGGENVPTGVALGRSLSQLTIVDNDANRGVLTFAVTNYTVSESTKFAQVTVIRTNGSAGTIQVNYSTADGTATTPADYIAAAGTLTFGPGVTNQTFQVQIVNDTIAEDDEVILLRLANPTGGSTLGMSNAVLTIVDNDSPNGRLNFASSTFSTNENAGSASITVTRSGASTGTLRVYYATSNGTAISGVDYTGVTNQLVWNSGDVTPKTFLVPLTDDQAVNGNRTVNLRLYGVSLNGATNAQSATILGGVSNAVLTIVDDDSYGQLAFTRSTYKVNENGGPAIVTVTRATGIAQSVSVNFATVPVTANAGVDYVATNGVLVFGPGEVSKSFTVALRDNNTPNFGPALAFAVQLTGFAPGATHGFPDTALINIIDDETVNEPAGSPDTTMDTAAGANGDIFAMGVQANGQIVIAGDFTEADHITRHRIARLNPLGTFDSSFSYPSGGADAAVRALKIQTDGRILVGGLFTNINGTVVNHIARLNYGSSIDTTFNIGAGADNVVYALAETFAADGTRRVLAGGSFVNYNGISRNGIVQIRDDGNVDANFDVGAGANGPVYAVLPYPTNSVRAGQILIAGDFTTYNNIARTRIARLFPNGSLDTTFDVSAGADAAVRALLLQSDERIIVGGLFTNFNGVVVNHITRLNANGTRDTSFNAGTDDAVLALAVQDDNKIIVGGQFTIANGITRHSVTRLNPDGSPDPAINFGLGCDSFVAAVAVQPDSKIVLAGGFTHYDGEAHDHLVRIYGGAINGSGTLEFDSPTYSVNENGTNAFITLRRRGGTSGFPSGNVTVTMATSNGTAIAGVNYTAVVTNVVFPPGEIISRVAIPITDDFQVNGDRTVNLSLSNPQPAGDPALGAPALGNQSTALLTIINDDSSISFSSATYSVNENTGLGAAVIQFVRTGSTNNPASVDFITTTNGTALPGINFTPVTNTITFLPGQTNALTLVPVLYDHTAQGNRTVIMQLNNVVNAILLDPAQATLTIIDVEHAPGQFVFTTNSYYIGENAGSGPITILRTNGSSGVVSVQFATLPGSAIASQDYFATNGTLTFADGETVKTFNIRTIDDSLVQGPRTLTVALANPTGGASLIDTNAQVTILDNDIGIGFSSPVYTVSEGSASVTLSVFRLNGSNGAVSVQYASSNVTATAGSDYLPANGTLSFGNGETLKTLTIPILQDNLVEGDETFTVSLFNISPSNAAQMVTATATVTILDDDAAFAFTNAFYQVMEGNTNLSITILRTNAQANATNSVIYFTSDGTATAGQDYLATSGVLTFTNGETYKTILVPILGDTIVEGNETFSISLTNATGGAQLVGLTNTTIQIIDDDAGFAFTSASYAFGEGSVQISNVITVARTGYTSNTVSVSYTTSDSQPVSAAAGADYIPTSGVLTFTNGELSKTFTVGIIDDNVVEGNETFLVNLFNPIGQAQVLSPGGSAVITVLDNDGSLILPAGSSLLSETGPVNGAIDPGERVTLWLALRNSIGVPTANLTATLMVTNGVSAPSPSGPVSYGVLFPGGASVSRQFSFTAGATNTQISATLLLQDGSTNLGTATFTYLLGTNVTRYTNSTAVTIRDNTNAVPYPTSIVVSNLNGVITKAAVTLTNLTHAHANDVDMLVTAPGGAKMLILANNGGPGPMSGVTLTLDDTAATAVPVTNSIVSGTNRPNPSLPVSNFPDPAPAPPYATALNACNGSNPNGIWSLFVMDDAALDAGTLGGWILSLTTASVVPGAADLVVSANAVPAPVVVGSNLTYTIGVTNYGPSAASNVAVTNALPAGFTIVSVSNPGCVTNGNVLTFTNLGTLVKDASLSLTIVVKPTVVGTFTNVVGAAATEADPYTVDNQVIVPTTVANPSADLGMAMYDSPSPVSFGANLTYTLVVSNLGPATATSVALTNILPSAVSFVSASPAGYTLSGSTLIFTNLGNLGSGALTTAQFVVKPTAPGLITNSAAVGSTILDPLKANNAASVKTIVQAASITGVRSGNNLIMSWPSDAGTFVLEGASSLQAPISWSTVASPAPQLNGGVWTVTIPFGSSNRYFRLRQTGP